MASQSVHVLTLTLILSVWCVVSGAASAATATSAHEKIRFATYGHGYYFHPNAALPTWELGNPNGLALDPALLPRMRVDVTDRVKAILLESVAEAGDIYLIADTGFLGVSDPAPGYYKTLQIIFTEASQQSHMIIREGSYGVLRNGYQAPHPNFVDPTSPMQAPCPFRAWYGLPNSSYYGGTQNQFLERSRQALDYGYFTVSQTAGNGAWATPAADPAPGLVKLVSIFWDSRLDGHQGAAVVYEGEEVYFPPATPWYG